ncbi:DNA recombination protein RmuC [uncultured Campylobacter sp.]|uniref:DNA recombination protein RmuC n=1 Tax=uncultured Campylobacter sp. TaxID=218934 RepID=UPI002625AF1C|nr:DNA recombination protein RmuC [uncultured Campylobacter sp.]
MNEILYALLAVFFVLLNYFLLKYNIAKNENLSLKLALKESKDALERLKEENKQEQNELVRILKEEHSQNLKNLKEELQKNYQNQSSSLLSANYNLLNEGSKKILNDIFKPINEKIKAYNERLSQNEISLQTSIKNMFSYSQKIADDAQKLAQILKGDKKVRGNFAELQLQSVLRASGLKEEEQYKTQVHFKKEGKDYYIDAVVFLDRNKNIIIDSKFALPNDFSLEENSEDLALSVAKNLKDRIDELSKKPYNAYNAYTYDFVLLFLPYQNILDLALSAMPNIYQYAYTKKIYLTSPHTLFMALNTINISWRHIQSNENILKAFDELGLFYDKFVSFTQDFKKLRASADALQNNLENLENKLISGRGNLSVKFEKLKDLGAKTSKQIALQYNNEE